MAIPLDFDFERTSPNPIDSSFVLTKAQMLAIDDNKMPDKYFAVCKDDGAFYLYDKSATPSATTGKFAELKGGGGGEEGKTYTMDWAESTHELTLTDGTTPQKLELTGLQSELTAGSNISIVEDPYTGTTVISSTGGSGTGNADFALDTTNNSATISNNTQGIGFDLSETNVVTMTASEPGTYQNSKILATKNYVDNIELKTINNVSIKGSGNIDTTVVGSDWGVAKTGGEMLIVNISSVTINISDLNLSSVNDYDVFITPTSTDVNNDTALYVTKTSATQFTIGRYNSSKLLAFRYVVLAKGYGGAPAGGSKDQILAKRSNATGDFAWVNPAVVSDVDQTYSATSQKAQSGIAVAQGIAATAGDLSQLLTTDQSDLVNAINEVYEKSGEPFRVKQWASNTLNATIPTCTTDVSNTSIPKLTFTIDDTEGADYQIVGMIAYEVFDAASGGNRINCWPVCQFTGNGQKELSVRFMCAGTSPQVAKRISAWVLLKHR